MTSDPTCDFDASAARHTFQGLVLGQMALPNGTGVDSVPSRGGIALNMVPASAMTSRQARDVGACRKVQKVRGPAVRWAGLSLSPLAACTLSILPTWTLSSLNTQSATRPGAARAWRCSPPRREVQTTVQCVPGRTVARLRARACGRTPCAARCLGRAGRARPRVPPGLGGQRAARPRGCRCARLARPPPDGPHGPSGDETEAAISASDGGGGGGGRARRRRRRWQRR